MILCRKGERTGAFFYYMMEDGVFIRINTEYSSLNRWENGLVPLTTCFGDCTDYELLVLRQALIKEMHSNVRMGN